MTSYSSDRLLARPDHTLQQTVWLKLQQPSVLVPLAILAFTAFYQSLHNSSSFSRRRHPGELLWDLIIATTPASFLYALDNWLHPPLFPLPDHMRPAQPTSYAAKCDVLRRILGLDKPGSVMSTVANAGKKSLTTLSKVAFNRNPERPPGLGNRDNSCFQNSILQGLSSLRPLPAYLRSALQKSEEGAARDGPGSAATLGELIANLTDGENNGTTLWTPKKLKSLDTWEQQDAQEYYSKILDEIEKELIKAGDTDYRLPSLDTAAARDDTGDSQHSDDSGYQSLPAMSKYGSEARILRNPLEGLVAQRVACVQCGYSDGLSMIPFNCLTLNLGVEQRQHHLFGCLDTYTTLEFIEGVECAKCTLLKALQLLNMVVSNARAAPTRVDHIQNTLARREAIELALEEDDFDEDTLINKCQISKQHRVTSTKTKQMVVARPPQSLAVHVNRSVFNEHTGQMLKNLAAVRFPETFDLGPWCLGSAGSPDTYGSLPTSHGEDLKDSALRSCEQWVMNPKASMVSGYSGKTQLTGPFYELRAVVTHQGRHENGHYVCYRKHPYNPSKLDATLTKDVTSEEPDDEGTTLTKAISPEDTKTTHSNFGLRWWRLSDETVWEVSEETVLAQGDVFMLFYDLVTPESVPVSEVAAQGASLQEDDASDMSEQFHDVQSRSENAESVQGAPPAQESVLGSSLLPLLREGETIDNSIPLQRPNS
ncbi:cysteine proteinase [Xylariaceae sp. FL0016]|nr:cysteine proteinase [Xylariaceae sp. FL0016]